MMGRPIRVLIVEDSEPEAELLIRELQQGGFDPEYQVVDTAEAMAAALGGQPWDIIVADYVMPHFSGPDALRMVKDKGLDTPVIMVSGRIDEQVLAAAMLAGARDCVLKNSPARLAPAVKREIADARRRQQSNEARRQAEEALRKAHEEMEQRIAERTAELLQANVMLGREIARREQVEEALSESEERFRLLADSSPVVLWVTNTEGGNLFVNKTFCEYFGVAPEEVKGAEWQLLVHPDDAQEYVGAFRRALREQSRFSDEARLRRADGEWRWLATYARPRFSESGEFLGHVGISLDITERRQAEMEVAAARAEAERRAAELQSFIASMADGVAAWDAAGRLVFLNDTARQILGVPPNASLEALSGRYELRTLEDEPMTEEQWGSRRALRGEEVKDFRARIVTPWKEATISYSAAPVLDSAGRVIGATSVLRDVSQQLEIEKRQRELYDREHHIAQMLQNALVPPMTSIDVEGCKAALRYEPALKEAEVGGDFYDVFELSDGRTGIVIGDVAGKGLDAAVYVAAAKHAIRSYAYLFDSPADVMTHANEALCRTELGGDMEWSMLTVFFGVAIPRKGAIRWANAGHEPPVIRHGDGSIEELDGTDIALGVVCGSEYSEHSHGLGAGDVVVMVTDGVTEARPSPALLFGKEGVLRFLAEHPLVPLSDIPSGLLEAAKTHGGGRLQDDAAIVALQCGAESSG